MRLQLTRQSDQSWRDAAIEQARRFGVEEDVAEYFDRLLALGDTEAEAALSACDEWGVLPFLDDKEPST